MDAFESAINLWASCRYEMYSVELDEETYWVTIRAKRVGFVIPPQSNTDNLWALFDKVFGGVKLQ